MRFFSLFQRPAAEGILLISAAALSLLLANVVFGAAYTRFWNLDIAGRPLEFWINDGLMTLFFLQIGLELREEMKEGALSDLKSAVLPALAAVGGMIVPVVVYVFFNAGQPTLRGVGIPMATDIAFALSIISLLQSRVPAYLLVFLKALAIFDDLGAILVIALFYTARLSIAFLAGAAAVVLFLYLLRRLNARPLIFYLAGGAALWYCLERSGVHPTISGFALAFFIPSAKIERLECAITPWVDFGVLPLFAAANMAVLFPANWTGALTAPLSLGVLCGLLLGKPAGIFLFSRLGVRLGWAALPASVQWKHVFGAGILGGIGFTMSIFITLLAFSDPALIGQSKTAILLASTAAAFLGYVFLRSVSIKTGGTPALPAAPSIE